MMNQKNGVLFGGEHLQNGRFLKRLIALAVIVCLCINSMFACSNPNQSAPGLIGRTQVPEPSGTATTVTSTGKSAAPEQSAGVEGALEPNQVYSGFKLLKKTYFAELDTTSYEFQHERTKATLVYLDNNSENRVFSTVFRISPQDNTGVFHIIEHGIARHCKCNNMGKAYTKDNFSQYCVTSKNNDDLCSDIDALLHGIYNPEFLTDKNVFLTEGWRYELDSTDAPLKVNGIVYNEISGKTSSFKKMSAVIFNSLFPNTSSRFNVGGVVDDIPKLQYEQFLSTYKKYYVPANSYMCLIGKADIKKVLELIDLKYLSNMATTDFQFHPQFQKAFTGMKDVHDVYPVNKGSNTQDKTILAISYVLGDSSDAASAAAFDLLELLLTSDNSTFLKTFQDNNMFVYSESAGLPQRALSFVLEGANSSDKEKFKTLVIKALEDIVKSGFTQDQLASAFNTYEMSARSSLISQKKDDIMISKTAQAWIFHQNIDDVLSNETIVNTLREKSKSRYFEGLIQKCILNNPHASYVILTPRPGLKESLLTDATNKLVQYKKSLTKDQLSELVQENKNFLAYQKKVTLEQETAAHNAHRYDAAKLDRKAETIQTTVNKVEGLQVLNHTLPTCGIGYVNFYFDTRKVDQSQLLYLILLSKMLGKVSTSNGDASDLNNKVFMYTGGIESSVYSYEDCKKPDVFYPKLKISMSVLNANLANGFDILKQIVCDSKFADKEELRKQIKQLKLSITAGIDEDKFSYASAQALSNVSQNERYNSLGNISFYTFISDLDANFDLKYREIVSSLQNVYKTAFDKENLIVSYTGDKDNYPLFESQLTQMATKLRTNDLPINQYKFNLAFTKQGYSLPIDVQDIVQAGNYRKLGFANSGRLVVLREVLSDYLYDEVRMKGGAYDAGVWIDDSYVVMNSSEDPNLSSTVSAFQHAGAYLKKLNLGEKDMERYRYGAIQYIDANRELEPRNKGVEWDGFYINGKTQEDLQKCRDEIFAVTAQDISKYSTLIDGIMSQGNLCVVGNKQKMEEEPGMFDAISDILTK